MLLPVQKKKKIFLNLKNRSRVLEPLRQAVVKGFCPVTPGLDVVSAEFSFIAVKTGCRLGVLRLSQSGTEWGRADPVETLKEETFPQVTVRPSMWSLAHLKGRWDTLNL